MDKNPYDILGISETASNDEVKKAYRTKARENHPDLNPNDPAAAKRMNEINEAYDRIINPEKYTRRQATGSTGGSRSPSGYGSPYQGNGYGGAGSSWDDTRTGQGGSSDAWPGYIDFDDLFGGGWAGANATTINPEVAASDSPEMRSAVNDINTGRYAQAVRTLNAIPSVGRNARWYYLSALANNGVGNTLSALEQIGKATRLEPDNDDYAYAYRVLQQTGQSYQQESQQQGFTMGTVSPGAICCGLFMMQYLCRFLGVGF